MYLDPGLGSMLIQIIGAVVVSAGVLLGVFWKKITAFFQTKKIAHMEKKLKAQAEKKASQQ